MALQLDNLPMTFADQHPTVGCMNKTARAVPSLRRTVVSFRLSPLRTRAITVHFPSLSPHTYCSINQCHGQARLRKDSSIDPWGFIFHHNTSLAVHLPPLVYGVDSMKGPRRGRGGSERRKETPPTLLVTDHVAENNQKKKPLERRNFPHVSPTCPFSSPYAHSSLVGGLPNPAVKVCV